MIAENALRGRSRRVPAWLVALQLAEAWGMPPWEVLRAPGSLRWAHRWAVYQQAINRIRESQR